MTSFSSSSFCLSSHWDMTHTKHVFVALSHGSSTDSHTTCICCYLLRHLSSPSHTINFCLQLSFMCFLFLGFRFFCPVLKDSLVIPLPGFLNVCLILCQFWFIGSGVAPALFYQHFSPTNPDTVPLKHWNWHSPTETDTVRQSHWHSPNDTVTLTVPLTHSH